MHELSTLRRRERVRDTRGGWSESSPARSRCDSTSSLRRRISRLGRSAYDPRTGVLAATLLAVSPYHITYSQEGRAYSLLIFLTLWSCSLLAQLVRQVTPGRRIGFVLVTAALLYTHLYAVFVALAQVIAFLLSGAAGGSSSAPTPTTLVHPCCWRF